MADLNDRVGGSLSDEEFQEQCGKLSGLLADTIKGNWHPNVVITVISEVIAMTLSMNNECMHCAGRALFGVETGIRHMIDAGWDDWQASRAAILQTTHKPHDQKVH